MPEAVLVVSGDPWHRGTLAAPVRGCGLKAWLCATAAEAWEPLVRGGFLAVLSEDTLPDGDFTSLSWFAGGTTGNPAWLPSIGAQRTIWLTRPTRGRSSRRSQQQEN